MNEVNVEIPMLLNSELMKRNILLVNSKIIHLEPKNTSNNHIHFKSGMHFLNDQKENYYNQERIFKYAFNHMVNCLVPLLKNTPVFFGVVKYQTFDKSFLDEFEENRSIPKHELSDYKKNYLDYINLLDYLASDDLESIKMGKKVWDLNDLKIL